MLRRNLPSLVVVVALALGACAPAATPEPTATLVPPTATQPPPTATPAPFTLTSPAFENNQEIPVVYSCEGENISPPLAWMGVPAGTVSLTLIMEDPDAVAVVGKVYDHWLLFNIPPSTTNIAEKVPLKNKLADGSLHGRNSNKLKGYAGPCPPQGPAHNYTFTLYALDILLPLEDGANKEELLAAMEGHILAQTQLVGKFAATP